MVPITLQIQASNLTHFGFSATPADAKFKMRTLGYGRGVALTGTFTGTLLGVYATTNGGKASFHAYISNWVHQKLGQVIN